MIPSAPRYTLPFALRIRRQEVSSVPALPECARESVLISPTQRQPHMPSYYILYNQKKKSEVPADIRVCNVSGTIRSILGRIPSSFSSQSTW
jgi:hypothetical protein